MGQREDKHLVVRVPEKQNVRESFDDSPTKPLVALPRGELIGSRPRSLDLGPDLSDEACAKALLARLIPASGLDELYLSR